jgi:SEC-C motif
MTTQTTARPGRNEPCRCGSGKKYKHCCLENDDRKAAAARAKAAKADEAPAAPPEATAAPAKDARPLKPKTDQPWKAGGSSSTRGFAPRSRTPRKVGGG